MGAMASQITSVSSVYSTVCSGVDQWKYQSSASLAFVRGIYGWPVNSPHKGPVTRKMFPFDDVIIILLITTLCHKGGKCDDYWIWGIMFVKHIMPGIKLECSRNSKRLLIHGDVIAWKRFPYNWPFVRGIHCASMNSTSDSRTEGPWCYTLNIYFLLAWASRWIEPYRCSCYVSSVMSPTCTRPEIGHRCACRRPSTQGYQASAGTVPTDNWYRKCQDYMYIKSM